MKKNILTLTIMCLALFAVGTTNSTDINISHNNNLAYGEFAKGWKDGYCEGWKDVKGSFAICPIAPIAPIPPIGKNSYRGGYNMGFKAGMRAASKN